MGKNDENWLANYEALKAYIDEHHHLPPKNAPLGAKYLLNFALCGVQHKAKLETQQRRIWKLSWLISGLYRLCRTCKIK